MSTIHDFDRILKTECNLQHFTGNCRIKNLDSFKRDEADGYLWRAGFLNVKEKEMTISYIMNRCFLPLERRKYKCCAVLMNHCRKVKDKQVIYLQMDQQLKTKSINVVPGQLFCRQCKAKLMIKVSFNLLQILTVRLLSVKHQGRSSSQLAFLLSAYTHLWKL